MLSDAGGIVLLSVGAVVPFDELLVSGVVLSGEVFIVLFGEFVFNVLSLGLELVSGDTEEPEDGISFPAGGVVASVPDIGVLPVESVPDMVEFPLESVLVVVSDVPSGAVVVVVVVVVVVESEGVLSVVVPFVSVLTVVSVVVLALSDFCWHAVIPTTQRPAIVANKIFLRISIPFSITS